MNIGIISTIFFGGLMGISVYLLLKNENTSRQFDIILDAIYFYQVDCAKNDQEPLVTYSDMEPYDTTLLRFYDWGYTRILPRDKFELIKPYLNRKELN